MQAMAMIVEMRDPYTAGHQRRVTQLACVIAEKMGFSPDQITGLRLAGLIHDIGKVRVPAEILTNPNVLSEAEMTIIKMHPSLGYDLLKTLALPWPVADIINQHHERLNGSGYPSGLIGDDILPEAKILAVADVVEAIASHRPYRPALGIDKALEEILKNRDILYDPEVVDFCVKIFRDKDFKFQ
jgi:putative nucleotidyltransferase with HDIG domain